MPWDELAFPVVRESLKLYFQDKKSGKINTHYGDIVKQDDESIIVVNY